MKHLRPAFVATSLLFAACPPPGGITEEGSSGTDSEGESTTGTSNAEVTQTTPASEPTTTEVETSNTTMGVSESESMSGPDTDPSTTTTTTDPPTGCRSDADCPDSDKPFCGTNSECGTCGGAADPNAACAGVSGDLPVCVDDACVECAVDGGQCDASAPVCDPDTNTCGACTAHSDCLDSACNFETGTCNDALYVIYVDRLAADCAAADGSKDAPYCSVTEAIANKVALDLAPTWTVKIKAGNYIETPIVLPDTVQITLSGWDGTPKLKAADDGGPTLTIGAGSKVYLDHLAFNGNESAAGVLCGGATVYADDTRFASNELLGYNSTDCTSTFQRSVFFANRSGGIASYGPGTTKLINSYVSGNGSVNGGDFGGIRSAQGNELHLIYSTVINNISMSGPRSIHCTDDGVAEIRNSVVIAFASPSVDCPLGVFSTSVLDEGGMDGDTNMLATMADINNFFNPPVQGVYKVKDDALIKDFAVWIDGDPKTDYDGTPRPNTDGSPDWPGADAPSN